MIRCMRSLWRLGPALLLVSAPALAACGGDSDNTTDDAAPPASSSPSAPPSSTSPTAETSAASTDTDSASTAPSDAGLPGACDVLTPADVQAAFGVEFGPGQIGGGGTAEGDLAWGSDNCDWEATDLLEVELALTGPDDFTGDFTCPEPPESVASTYKPVAGLGSAAYWEVEVSPPLEATLRVCTGDYNFDYEGKPKDQAIALAKVVLAALG
jgi:hypothetical protein